MRRKGYCDKDKWIWNVDEAKINKSEWNEVKADEGKIINAEGISQWLKIGGAK